MDTKTIPARRGEVEQNNGKWVRSAIHDFHQECWPTCICQEFAQLMFVDQLVKQNGLLFDNLYEELLPKTGKTSDRVNWWNLRGLLICWELLLLDLLHFRHRPFLPGIRFGSLWNTQNRNKAAVWTHQTDLAGKWYRFVVRFDTCPEHFCGHAWNHASGN